MGFGRARLLMSLSRSAGTEVIFALGIDQQDAVPFGLKALGTTEPFPPLHQPSRDRCGQ